MRTSIDEYCSNEMAQIWSPLRRVVLERELWILIMQLQRQAGVPIPQEGIDAYLKVYDQPDLFRIAEIEQVTRHDLRARLHHFNEQADQNYAHWGLTSCDITENATSIQMREASMLLLERANAVLDLLRSHIRATLSVFCVARTHNQPAQATLLAKRFATIADELLGVLGVLAMAVDAQPCRGLSGAVGTAQDLVTLLGDPDTYAELNAQFIERLRFKVRLSSPAQVMARSVQLEQINAVRSLVAPLTNLALMVRLEAGFGRMWEAKTDGQIGSSAMPHKNNPVLSERICGLRYVADGFHLMLAQTSGQQWYEGDVSDSVTRRIGLAGLFKTVDAALVNAQNLLLRLDLNKDVYRDEVLRCRDELRTGDVLAAALRAGADRDRAYDAIQQAEGVWDLIPSFYSTFPLSIKQIEEIVEAPFELPEARFQIDETLAVIDGAIGKAD